MSENSVFGTAIDAETLRGMPEYEGKEITQADMAKVARDLKSDDGKTSKCMAYLQECEEDDGYGFSAMCMVYNATGDDLNYVLTNNYHGHNSSRSPVPSVIKNGQWGGWLHVRAGLGTESCAAVVYRGTNLNRDKKDWLFTWSIRATGENKVYTEIREEGHYENNDYFDLIRNKIYEGSYNSHDTFSLCTSVTSIDTDNTAFYYAIASLEGP